MATTNTTHTELGKPGLGDSGWGTTLNTTLDKLDALLAASLSKSVAGGSDVTLTKDEVKGQALTLTGTLTANINVVLPRAGTWVIYNNTSGAYTVTIKGSAGGTGTEVTQGQADYIFGDGTNALGLLRLTPGATLGLEDLTDPGADRILFWDDSAGKLDWLTAGTGLSISTTTISIDSTVATLTGAQTLTNKTLTSPTINAGALSGTFTGNPTLSGNPVFSGAPDFSGATNKSTIRSNLGLAIGSDVQAYDAGLASIAGLTTAADRMIYTTASDTYAVATLTSFARTILDDADAATVRSTLGLVIGTNVQAYNANLAAIAALAVTDGNFVVGNGSTWVAESGATARASLGLGTIATQAASSVAITGGAIDGTAIGGTTPAAGVFTTLKANTNLNIAVTSGNGVLNVNGGAGVAAEFVRSDNGQILELDGNGYSAHHTLDGTGYLIGHDSAARSVELQTNSTTRLKVHAGGDVEFVGAGGSTFYWDYSTDRLGIGTTSPAYTLDVSGAFRASISTGVAGYFNSPDNNNVLLIGKAGVYDLYLGADGTNARVFAASGAGLIFGANGAEAARIDSSGNVGIGTTSPQVRLHAVVGSGSGITTQAFSGTGLLVDGSGATYAQIVGGAASALALYFGSAADGDLGGLVYDNSTGLMTIRTAGAGRAYINGSGNVGIGTTSPTVALDVNGTIKGLGIQGTPIGTTTAAAGAFTTLSASGTASFTGGATVSGADLTVTFKDIKLNDAYKLRWGSTAGSYVYGYDNGSTQYIGLATQSTPRLFILSTGEVGIGTTTPSELLDVNSDAIRVRTAQTPASAAATGSTGMICWDSNYIYVCTGTNTWKRAALATW